MTNHGPGNSSGYVVDDAVPAGVTNVTALTAGCVVTGNHVQCAEGALAGMALMDDLGLPRAADLDADYCPSPDKPTAGDQPEAKAVFKARGLKPA